MLDPQAGQPAHALTALYPRIRRRAAGVAVGIIGAVALMAAATPAAASPAAVTGGSIDWGVKGSFVAYVTGPIGQGTALATGGASGGFSFPIATGSRDIVGDTFSVAADGGVRFSAHHGALDLSITNLRVTKSGPSGALVADVSSKGMDSPTANTFPSLELATLDFSAVAPSTDGTTTTFAGIPATLTEGGSAAFTGFYPAGTPMDPVTVTMTMPPLEDPGSSTTSTTTTSTTTPGGPTTSTPAPGVTTTTVDPAPTAPGTPQSPRTGARAALPRTGTSPTLGLVGLALFVAGAAMVTAGRRSPRHA